MATMNKKKLIQVISRKRAIPVNQVEEIIQTFFDALIENLLGNNRLEFREFGIFEVVKRKQRIARNPQNASIPIVVPERWAVKFTSSKKMRTLLDKKQS